MHWNWPAAHCDQSIFRHGFRSTLLHHKIAEFTVHHGITYWYILVFFNTVIGTMLSCAGLFVFHSYIVTYRLIQLPDTHISNGITVCTRYIHAQADRWDVLCTVSCMLCICSRSLLWHMRRYSTQQYSVSELYLQIIHYLALLTAAQYLPIMYWNSLWAA